MVWSFGNIDQAATAAWVQALGSVAAIAAAIWIDQGSARRLRQDSKAAEKRTSARRLAAIVDASSALKLTANEFRARTVAINETAALSHASYRRLRGAKAVLDYHLRQATELDNNVLAGLALAAEAYAERMNTALTNQPVIGPENSRNYVAALDAAAREIMEIHGDLRRALAQNAA